MLRLGSIEIPIDNPFVLIFWFFTTIGWIIPVFFFCWGLILTYQNWIRSEYRRQRRYILLAIDIPKNNEQTLRAVENFFSHLSGAHQPLKFNSLWWKGEVPESFGFEIVSIGGQIQYIIHFADIYRDLVEAAIYAQYPDAEITEVADYTKRWNIKFPHDKYQAFATELKLANKDVYPIITYKEFEDTLSGELKDPMAGILEAMNRVGQGEEMWLQILVTPADNDWGNKAKPIIDKIIGAKTGPKKDFLYYLFLLPQMIIDGFTASAEPSNGKSKSDGPLNNMLYLTEGDKSTVAAIQGKTGKTGFHVRIRWIYITPKESYSTIKALHTVYGAFKQYNSLGSNGFKNDLRYLTASIFFFKKVRLDWRRNRMMIRYKNRGHFFSPGEYGFILNSEELASLWHFPTFGVKAPLVQRSDSKKSEPPSSLPVVEGPASQSTTAKTMPRRAAAPTNLPK